MEKAGSFAAAGTAAVLSTVAAETVREEELQPEIRYEDGGLNPFIGIVIGMVAVSVFCSCMFACFQQMMKTSQSPNSNYNSNQSSIASFLNSSRQPQPQAPPPPQMTYQYPLPPGVYPPSSHMQPGVPTAQSMVVAPGPLGYPSSQPGPSPGVTVQTASPSAPPPDAEVVRAREINKVLEALPAFTAGTSVQDELCPLCFDAFGDSLVTMGGYCMHMVHLVCLTSWLSKAPVLICPICRQPLIPSPSS